MKRLLYLLASVFWTRVRSGPLRGCRWTLLSGIRFVRGDHEPKKTGAIIEALRPNDVFWDVGAHVGYFSVIASRIVGRDGAVVSVEPSPVNLAYLRRNLRLNRVDNARVYALALGSQETRLQLSTRSGRGTHKIHHMGDTNVRVETVDTLISRGAPPPNLIKIDVEGFEIEVLRGSSSCLAVWRPKLLLAVHSAELEREAHERLIEAGYSLQARLEQSKGDIELLYIPREIP